MTEMPLPYQHLGRYDITRVLGQGAMGVVFEGRDPNLDRRVAIKTVRVVGLISEEAREYENRFKTEARSAGRLQHANIVSVYDAGKHEDALGATAYIVMEFVEGKDLKDYLDAGRRFSLEQTVFMMNDLLAALAYAHEHKIIHRDIKPANMLLTSEGRIKLTDFGVARIQDSGEATRTQGGTVGTLKYMSPEQVAGKGVDAASDIFSAGVVLYQLLTGVRPFDGEGYLDIASKIIKQDPPVVSSLMPGLPPSLDAVVAKALAKSKLDRFADATSFAMALKQAIQNADMTITPNSQVRADLAGLSTFPGTIDPGAKTNGSTVTQELELVYWKDIKDSQEPEILEGFLKRFPWGVYSDLAKRKLKSVTDANQAAGGASRYDTTQLAAPAVAAIHSDLTMMPSVKAKVPPAQAFNDSVYGASTQFAPTQFPSTSHGDEDTSGFAATQIATDNVPLESDLATLPGPIAVAKAKEESAQLKASAASPKEVSRSGKASASSAASGKTSSKAEAQNTAVNPNQPKRGLFAMIALVLAAGGAAAWWLGSSPAPKPSPAPAIITPTAVVSPPAESASSTAPAAAAPTPVPATPVVAPATEPVNPPEPAPTVAVSVTSTTSQAKLSPATKGASAPRVPVPAKKSSAPEPTRTSAPETPASASAPVPKENPKPAAPAEASKPSNTPAPGVKASANPQDICKDRVLFGYLSCISEQCSKPVMASHPVCVDWREKEDRRRASETGR